MHRVEIHSKKGSLALGVAGLVDVLCALATLLIYVNVSWGAIGTLDLVLQLMLVGSAVAGLLLSAIALDNLGVLHRRGALTHALRGRRKAVVTSS
jgi:hypothetical protein